MIRKMIAWERPVPARSWILLVKTEVRRRLWNSAECWAWLTL